MVTVIECGTQVDIRSIQDAEIRLPPNVACTSVGVQVEEDELEPETADDKEMISDGLALLNGDSPSAEVIIEDRRLPKYRCDYCYGCLLCDQEHPWYSLRGKAFLWVLLLTPGYLVLGVVLLPFFILMGIAYCVAAAIE